MPGVTSVVRDRDEPLHRQTCPLIRTGGRGYGWKMLRQMKGLYTYPSSLPRTLVI